MFELNKQISPLIAGGWLTPEGKESYANAWAVNTAVFVELAECVKTEERRKAELACLVRSPKQPR